LRAAGVRTGLYSSPHLSRFTERIQVGGIEIGRAEATARVAEVEQAAAAANVSLTFFEVVTLAAFAHFRAAGVELAVVEVGLGGRLDATNLLSAPLATVVTGVALDHQDYLGTELASIAREKAGIFKPGRPAVVALPDE